MARSAGGVGGYREPHHATRHCSGTRTSTSTSTSTSNGTRTGCGRSVGFHTGGGRCSISCGVEPCPYMRWRRGLTNSRSHRPRRLLRCGNLRYSHALLCVQPLLLRGHSLVVRQLVEMPYLQRLPDLAQPPLPRRTCSLHTRRRRHCVLACQDDRPGPRGGRSTLRPPRSSHHSPQAPPPGHALDGKRRTQLLLATSRAGRESQVAAQPPGEVATHHALCPCRCQREP